jgi:hypothetical protein
MLEQMPELTTFMPDLRRYLLGFPKVELRAATSSRYWQDAQFGLKPTIRINHVTIRETPEERWPRPKCSTRATTFELRWNCGRWFQTCRAGKDSGSLR